MGLATALAPKLDAPLPTPFTPSTDYSSAILLANTIRFFDLHPSKWLGQVYSALETPCVRGHHQLQLRVRAAGSLS